MAPYATFQIFDVEHPPEEQRVPRGEFDVVIAANVLHATRHIGHSLQNVKACLKRHGLLVLNEIGAKRPFTTLTFGLLDGWWLAQDRDVRLDGSPALTLARWQRCLADEGFAKVLVPGGSSSEQFVIVAESDGSAAARVTTSSEGSTGRDVGAADAAIRRFATTAPGAPVEPTDAGKGTIERSVLACVAGVLKLSVEDIDPDKPLSEVGVDSIVAVDLVRRINQALGLALRTTVIFDHFSVRLLSQHIHGEHGAHVGQSHEAAPEEPGDAADAFAAIAQELAQGTMSLDEALERVRA